MESEETILSEILQMGAYKNHYRHLLWICFGYRCKDMSKQEPTIYLCPDCKHAFESASPITRCPNKECASLNLERFLPDNRLIKADASETAVELIHPNITIPICPECEKPILEVLYEDQSTYTYTWDGAHYSLDKTTESAELFCTRCEANVSHAVDGYLNY